MKVICISNKLKYTGITIGKEYEIIPELLSQISDFYINDDIYHIRSNNGWLDRKEGIKPPPKSKLRAL